MVRDSPREPTSKADASPSGCASAGGGGATTGPSSATTDADGVAKYGAGDGDGIEAAIRVAKALADPVRLRMLNAMAAGRAACCTPSPIAGTPPGDEPAEGICVCELQSLIGLAQSRASYHLRILKDAGLVTETTRGKWNYYALDREALAGSLTQLAIAAGAPSA